MKAIFGGILLAAGILIAGASGLCSLVFMFSEEMGPANVEFLSLILLFGGVPFVAGAATAYGGYVMLRNARAEADQANKSE